MSANLSDKTILRALRGDMEAALKPVGERHGITFKTTKIRYEADGTGATISVIANAPDADGNIKSKEEKDFENYAYLYQGLKKEDLGREVRYGLKKYKIVGLRPRSRKYPLVATCEGKRYCLPISAATINLHERL